MVRLLLLFAAHRGRGRMALSIVGIALGVALGYGVHLVNRAAVSDVAAAVRSLAGEADLEVRGGRTGFAEALYPKIAQLPGVAVASPALELDVGVAGTERTLRITGIDILRAALLQPSLILEERYELLAPDRVFLSTAASETLGIGKGDELSLVAGQSTVKLKVVGILSSLRGVTALTDIATAQWRFGRLGELNRIDVRLSPGAERHKVAAAIQALLPPGSHVAALEALEEASAYPSRSYRVNLNVLAMVALFTGGFLVFSAQALEVARRRGEHALLRVLGINQKGISRLVLVEAALLGALGAAVGLVLGYALALAAVRWSGADLGAGMFRGLAPHIEINLAGALVYFLAGILVAVLGALLPALDAARTPPARALKAGDEQTLFERIAPLWPGIVLLGLGALLAQLGPVNGVPLFGYAAIACLLVGAIALVPRVAQWLFNAIPLPQEIPLRLALGQLRAAPGQAAVSLAAIVASFALMAAMAIMVASFRQSVDDWLQRVLPAEVYFRTTHAGDTGILDPGFEERVRALPQVARVDFLRSGRLLLDPARPPLVLIARDRAEKAFPVLSERYERRAGDPPAVWVSEAVADLYGFTPGRRPGAADPWEKARCSRRRHFPGLRAAARRGAHRSRRLRRADRRPRGERRRAVARARNHAGGGDGGVARAAGRRAARHGRAGGDPRCLAAHLRPQLRGHLRHGGGRGAGRPVRPFGEPRRDRACAPARIRRAAPPRPHARPDPRHARRRGRPARAGGLGRRPCRRRGDQPGAGLRHQPPVIPLEHGASPAVPAPAWICLRPVPACRPHRHHLRQGSDGDGTGARRAGGLVGMRRRAFLSLGVLPFSALAAKTDYAVVKPHPKFVFPRDHGAHPEFRVEWWYVTGWLETTPSGPMGFQVTFFRARPEEASDNPSSFNPRQVLFAHAALSDPKRGRLLHDQRAARAGFSLAHAELDRTGVWIDDWRLELEGHRYQAKIAARDFEFDFTLFAQQIILQGDGGFSRKGHRPEEASYYYSRPQLNVVGKLNGRDVEGTAWLDHEWSSAYMAPEATGWDWCGINLVRRRLAHGLSHAEQGRRRALRAARMLSSSR